ncbi:hypothetical protein GCM10027276_41630 [Comamonas piscis]
MDGRQAHWQPDSPPPVDDLRDTAGPWLWRLWVVVPLMVLLGTALVQWLAIHASQQTVITQLSAQQADETEMLARMMGSKLEQSQKVLGALAETAAPWVQGPASQAPPLLDQGVAATRYFDSLVFARGTQVFRRHVRDAGDGDDAVEPTERDLLRRVMVDGKPLVSEPFRSASGGPSIALGIPLRDRQGTVRGAMAGVLRLQSQSLLPVSLATTPPNSGQLVLMTAGGVLISHPDPARILGTTEDDRLLAQVLQRWQERSVSGGAQPAQSWWLAPHLVSVAQMPAARWLVVRVMPHEQSLQSWGRQWRSWWWLLLMPLALAALTWLWLWTHSRRFKQLVAQTPLPLAPAPVLAFASGPVQAADPASGPPPDEIDRMGMHLQELGQQRESLAEQLRQQQQLSESVLAHARFSFLLLQGDQIQQVSQALAHLLGYSRQDLQGQPVRMLAMADQDFDEAWTQLAPDLERLGSAETSVVLRHQSGAPVTVSLHLVNIADAGPDLRWCFVRAGQARVAALSPSRMDKLTLLPNYEALLLHLTALLQARREGLDQSSPSAPVLFYVNVDNMSAINALAGHAQGDLVLQHVARQLQLLQPFQGYAARVAGDKFALVLRQCSPEKAHELAAQLCDTLQNWQPQLRSKHFVVTVSIGLLQMDATFADALQVVRAADMASYSAKRQGGNRACWREAKVA